MTEASTSRRSFLATAALFMLAPSGCGGTSTRPKTISALGDSLSDTVFQRNAYPRWLAGYFPGVHVYSQGESGDDTAQVLARCWPSGIVDYVALARYLGTKLHPAPPGQYCSVLAGINDLVYRHDDATRITGNLARIYVYLRHHHSTPFPITILPWAHSQSFRPEREAIRIEVNRWIRSQPLAVDVEHIMGDGHTPPALRSTYDPGDSIHPEGAGPRVLARAVALRMRAYAER